jgi:hypothetical protein
MLQHDTKIKMFEIEKVSMNDERAVLFAETFHQNTTIKHLHLKSCAFLGASSALAFVHALPESIHFLWWDNNLVL